MGMAVGLTPRPKTDRSTRILSLAASNLRLLFEFSDSFAPEMSDSSINPSIDLPLGIEFKISASVFRSKNYSQAMLPTIT